jgi:hypothetical protein
MEKIHMTNNPIWIKDIRAEGPFIDSNGNRYYAMRISYRWLFLPIMLLDTLWRHIHVRVRLMSQEDSSYETTYLDERNS